MEILKGFIIICTGILALTLLDSLQTLLSTFTQYIVSCLSVKISEKNVKITKLDVLMNNIQSYEPNIIGFEAPDKYDDDYYYEDEDEEEYDDKVQMRMKETIGFKVGDNNGKK